MNLSCRIGEMLDAGVRSFKIEGRLKDTLYIRNVVAYYRRAVDEALASRPHLHRSSVGESRTDFTPDTAKSFTRGESEYFFEGKRAGVASFDTPKAVGEPIGQVIKVEGRKFLIDSDVALSAGDGLCFLTADGLVGTNINAVEGRRVTPNRIEGITAGAEVFRNYDHRFSRAVEASRTRRVIPTTATATVSTDSIELQYSDCEGVSVVISRSVSLDAAKNPEANAANIRAQASKSGDTIFTVDKVEVTGAEWFVPASLMAELRREALEKLLKARIDLKREHRVLPENPAPRYPQTTLSPQENVTNRLAEQFYRDHGVERIARGLDLESSTAGQCVMRSAYCLRREIGECLKRNPHLKGDLYLERGGRRYRLEFDCRNCEMCVIDEN